MPRLTRVRHRWITRRRPRRRARPGIESTASGKKPLVATVIVILAASSSLAWSAHAGASHLVSHRIPQTKSPDQADAAAPSDQAPKAAAPERTAPVHAGEISLRFELARLQKHLDQLGSQEPGDQPWLEQGSLDKADALEMLFAGIGLDVDTLVERATGPDMGQGGPLEVDIEPPPVDVPLPLDPGVIDEAHRLVALQRLARILPLYAPLDAFEVTSTYGRRYDPFTRQRAFHPGLDLGGPRGSLALATAPGRVVRAGRFGDYGNMVEIDHGMGVTTRYGHLKSIRVRKGQEVTAHQAIGTIGTTGRSTGRHLHYEIRIDDVPYDPARFLAAGHYLVGMLAPIPAARPVADSRG
ncbi:MAG: M23 family metallopeptidase [Geminicoccales bacterium]